MQHHLQRINDLITILMLFFSVDELTEWRMENEEWRMKNEEWRIKNEEWRIKNGEWRIKNS